MAERHVKLKSSDGDIFEVDEAVALESELLKGMIEEVTDFDAPIPLLNVTSKTLAKVIGYCKYHVENQKSSEGKPATTIDEMEAWDAKFLTLNRAILFDLMRATDYMDIKNLLDIILETIANIILRNNAEEIRTIFKIQNDFTPKDEEQTRKENQWAFRK